MHHAPYNRFADLVVDPPTDARSLELPRGQLALHGPDDVAALAHTTEGVLNTVDEPPLAATEMFRQPHGAEFAQPSRVDRLLERIIARSGDHSFVIHAPEQAPVNRCQSLLFDVVAEPRLDLPVCPRTQVDGRKLGRALTKTVRNILASDDEVLALIIDTAEDDMSVRLVGVEMINGDPVEFGAEVMLRLRHQSADVGLEVWIFGTVLGRYDEPELVTVAAAALYERFAICTIAARSVDLSGRAVARNAIALDVAQVRPSAGQPLRPQLHEPSLHNRPPSPQPGKAVPARQQASDARASPNSAAIEAPANDPSLASGKSCRD